jgi:hypothetical protein
MPYVSRDDSGRITGVFDHAEVGVSEQVKPDHPDLARFLADQGLSSPESIRSLLSESDLRMVRLVDDLIDLLIEKALIRFTDLPAAAGEKYLQRQMARKRLQGSLVIDEKDIL